MKLQYLFWLDVELYMYLTRIYMYLLSSALNCSTEHVKLQYNYLEHEKWINALQFVIYIMYSSTKRLRIKIELV